MEQERYLTSGAAAHLLSQITGRQYSAGIVRYYESTRRLPAARRTTSGLRLFREAHVRRLAEWMAARRHG